MDKPNRHKNHILETESSKFLENAIPNEWCIDKPSHDYGLDYNINIVINEQVTGLNFSVQLKSTEKDDNKDIISVVLKRSTLNLFQSRLEPVLLVAYIKEDKEAYWYWYNDLNIDLTRQQKTFTVNIPKSNKLSIIAWEEVIEYVKNIFSIKTLIEGIRSLEYKEFTESEILAWKYYYTANHENAIFYFKKVLNEKKDNASILEALVQSLYMSFNYQDALYYANQLIELSKNPNHYLLKASILTEDGILNNNKGKLLEGKKIFKTFIDKNPSQDYYYYNYANALSHLGEHQEAIKHYEKCLKINPNNAQAWKNLGGVYNQMQIHDKMLLCYDNALAINPDLKEALFSKGIILSQIYNHHEEALSYMKKSFTDEQEILSNYPHAYFWFAYVYEKLSDLKNSMNWINKGLEHFPQDIYFLNFKSQLCVKNWKKYDWIRKEAIDFFQYRIDLNNDPASIYHLIVVKELSNDEIFLLLKEQIPIFEQINNADFDECHLDIQSIISFLLHYEKYQTFREEYPLDRYLNHFISEHYIISSRFWYLLDIVFAYAFSSHLERYYEKDIEHMLKYLLDGLMLAPNIAPFLLEEKDYEQEESVSILAHIYLEFPNVICREIGLQLGYVASKLDLEKPNSENSIPESWYEEFREKTFFAINDKLKLFID